MKYVVERIRPVAPLKQNTVTKNAHQIAWSHCHKNRIFHNDIKKPNIVVMNEGMDVKIIDFGIARKIISFDQNKKPLIEVFLNDIRS